VTLPDAHEELRFSLAAYVMGALTPPERDVIDAHLADCPGCVAELDQLTTLPLFLDLVSGEEVALMGSGGSAPDDHLVDRVVGAALAERRASRRKRWLASVAAAVVLIAGSSVAGVLLAPSDRPAVTNAAVFDQTDPGTHAWARIAVQQRGWGASLQLTLTGVPAGEHCKLVAVGRDGSTDVAASWEATYKGTATLTGATSLQLASTAAYDVVTFAGQRLVHVPTTAIAAQS
jgi:RNA polymerase sigma-70 factor (ECF subfamily)